MELKSLTERIHYLPHQPELDRPMLALLQGSRRALAVDAGYSPAHVQDFYRQLEAAGLPKPDYTILTHWHYDHTFGLGAIHGAAAAHRRTNEHLRRQREQAVSPDCFRQWKEEDPCFRQEFAHQPDPEITLADLSFSDSLTFRLGGLTAHAFHTEAPHSDDTVCVFVPEERVLFLGDSICPDYFHGSCMDLRKLRALIRTIEGTDCQFCLLSHEAPLEKAELLEYLYSISEN